MRFLGALERFLCKVGAGTAFGTDAEITPQIGQAAGAGFYGLDDLVLGDSVADTDVHRGASISRVANVRLQVIRQAEIVDQALLRLQPVDGFFAVLEQIFEQLAAHIIL